MRHVNVDIVCLEPAKRIFDFFRIDSGVSVWAPTVSTLLNRALHVPHTMPHFVTRQTFSRSTSLSALPTIISLFWEIITRHPYRWDQSGIHCFCRICIPLSSRSPVPGCPDCHVPRPFWNLSSWNLIPYSRQNSPFCIYRSFISTRTADRIILSTRSSPYCDSACLCTCLYGSEAVTLAFTHSWCLFLQTGQFMNRMRNCLLPRWYRRR